jgi:hypothetical protein
MSLTVTAYEYRDKKGELWEIHITRHGKWALARRNPFSLLEPKLLSELSDRTYGNPQGTEWFDTPEAALQFLGEFGR